MLSQEYNKVIYEWNETNKDYLQDQTITQLFESQVKKTPNNVAVVFEDKQLTYQVLNVEANKLARYLQSQVDIKPDTLIALCLDRSVEMIIGILGILKAGGAYVPIDPSYPDKRIQYILGDTKTRILLTQSHLIERLQKITKSKSIALDSNIDQDRKQTTNPPVQSKATDLAYVLYTSGTTGKPKGVCISHLNLSNLVFIQKEKLNIDDRSHVLQFASIAFDASVWEIFSTLTFGARLNIVPNSFYQSPTLFTAYLAENNIHIATIPPAFLNTLELTALHQLKTLVVAGESCPENVMSKWSQGRTLINAYGPTESTVCATLHLYKDGDVNTNIGHTDAVAGIAGLIKVCCMLQQRIIPGQVNFTKANPELHLEQTNFSINKQNRPWLSDAHHARLAGVSSFGIGGTNAHLIICEHVEQDKTTASTDAHAGTDQAHRFIFPISAKSRRSLIQYRQVLHDYLAAKQINQHQLADLAYSLQERRETFTYRSAYTAQTVAELTVKLIDNADIANVQRTEQHKTVLMFSGQGAQYSQMAKALYDHEADFRTIVDHCIEIANQHLDIDLYRVIYPTEKQVGQYDINATQWAQISLFIVCYSLAKYLQLPVLTSILQQNGLISRMSSGIWGIITFLNLQEPPLCLGIKTSSKSMFAEFFHKGTLVVSVMPINAY